MLALTQRRNRHDQDLPDELYASLVDSLFDNPTSMAAGAVCVIAAAVMIAWRSGAWWFWACAILMSAITLVRLWHMRSYAQHPTPRTTEARKVWEHRYAFGVVTYTSLLGLWCFLGIATTSDPVIHLLCSSVTIGNIAAGAGRNSGRSYIVVLQIACACGPLSLAFLLQNDLYYIGLGLLLMIFFLGLRRISVDLHETNLKALVATRDLASIATRFNTALNNMPHGLCMFDAERRVVVTNHRLREFLGVGIDLAQRRGGVKEFFDDCVHAGKIPSASAEHIAARFEAHLSGSRRGDLDIEIAGGRALALTFQPMENGGSVVLVEDVTERKNAEAKINYMARYDALTGLPNRTYFHDQMDQVLADKRRRGHSCAVLFIDLDQFKQINDTLGHTLGDHLLCAVADRLRKVLRSSDLVARFGGDEFVVLQAPIKRPEETSSLARKIIELLSQPYEIDGHRFVIGASIGIAVAADESVNVDLLLKNADMALYRAKSDGRNTWRFFESDMEIKAQIRRNLEVDLRNALANNAFEIFYQPIFNLKTHRISACEALLRWPHPQRGMISPAEFIPVAEEMGLIVELGKWVLRRACVECTGWPNDIHVAVNLSPIQFTRGDVVAEIREALSVSGLPAHRLEVEITESVLLQDTQATRDALDQLRELGISISLDDFGTGYSSLSYLHSLPLQKVKIDRSFLQGLGTTERPLTLLRGVARLSAQLGMSVVIEGVETEEQLALITAEDSIDEAQGFLFSMPIPGRQLLTLLEATSPHLRRISTPQRRLAVINGATP